MIKMWKIRSCTLKLYSVLLRHLGRPGPETHKLKVNSIGLVADVFIHIGPSSYPFSSIWTEDKDSSLCCACLCAASFQTDLCTLMCGKLKLSTWKVQLAVLQAMKAYFQGWGPLKHKLDTLDLGSLPQFELFLLLFFLCSLLLLEKGNEDTNALSQILTEACTALTYALGKEVIQNQMALIESLMSSHTV